MIMQSLRSLRAGRLVGLMIGLAVSGAAKAEPLSGQELTKALQGGGYVLVVRHASSPQVPPTAAEAAADNPTLERQLDEAGKRTATAMGQAFRALRLPLGEVWSSPNYRARQTVTFARLPAPKIAPELGDRRQSMQAMTSDQSAWLKAKAAEAPKPGADTVIVTHLPNITAAFGGAAAGLADGEALVFRPMGSTPAEPVARIKVDDWVQWAASGSFGR